MIAIYGRVSTDRQSDSIAAQDDKCTKYCSLQWPGLTPVVHLDEDTSGGVAIWERKGGKPLCDAIQAGQIRHLVVAKLDRIGRRARDFHNFLHFLDANRVTLHILDLGGSIATTEGVGKILLAILAIVAEFERDLIRGRVQDAINTKFDHGEVTGTVPYGWTSEPIPGRFRERRVGEGTVRVPVRRLIQVPEEQAVLRELLAWMQHGVSWHHMAKALNDRGLKAKQGGLWTYNGVRRLLTSKHVRRLVADSAQPSTEPQHHAA